MPFLVVQVEEHEDIPDGCSMRFRTENIVREVRRIRYESDLGEGIHSVVALNSDGTRTAARGALVEDSGAGLSLLVFGGNRGLRLTLEGEAEEVAEPYLLLDPAADTEGVSSK